MMKPSLLGKGSRKAARCHPGGDCVSELVLSKRVWTLSTLTSALSTLAVSVCHPLATTFLKTSGYGSLRSLRYRHLGIVPCNTQVISFGSLRAIVTAGSS